MKKRLLLSFCFIVIGSFLYAMEEVDQDLKGFLIVPRDVEIDLVHEDSANDLAYENINRQDVWGDTPLHRAIENEQTNEIEKLFKNGARCDIANKLEETPISLLFKKRKMGVDLVKYSHGCFFVIHSNNYKRQIPFLLKKNALYFNTIVENSMGLPDTKTVMLLLSWLFANAQKNTKYPNEGTVMRIEGIDCFIQIKLSDLERLYGKSTITSVKQVVDLYNPAKNFIKRCNDNLYDNAKTFLSTYPRLQSDTRFNKYIMSELLMNNSAECWQFLLESRFNAQTPHPIFGTILHGAAQALNQHAIYFLIYHGADVNAADKSGKNPITMLVERLQTTDHAENALSCLTFADKALEDRSNKLEHVAESLPLLIMRSYIERMIKTKNPTKR